MPARMMKQREWMGYAAAVLAAGAFLTGCGNTRKLAKSDPEVVFMLSKFIVRSLIISSKLFIILK